MGSHAARQIFKSITISQQLYSLLPVPSLGSLLFLDNPLAAALRGSPLVPTWMNQSDASVELVLLRYIFW